MEASAEINARRKNRGLKPRPVRAVVIGFPNVGKSALINRLLNRRVCDSAPKPGVTRNLKWLRLGGDLDLLDAPGQLHITQRCTRPLGLHRCGTAPPCAKPKQKTAEAICWPCNSIVRRSCVQCMLSVCLSKAVRLCGAGVIPASFSDQLAAQRLAMCNDIGEASYIDSFIAAALLQVLRALPSFPAINERLKLRFKVPLDTSMTGMLVLQKLRVRTPLDVE